MPLIDPTKPRRIDIEGEEGAWVEMVPLTAGDLELLQVDEAGGVKATRAALERCVRAWSYDAPVNSDSIKLLAIDTFVWMGAELMRVSGIRTPDEKKDSGDNSSGAAYGGSIPEELAYLMQMKWLREHGLISSMRDYRELPIGVLEDAELLQMAEVQWAAMAR